MSSWNCRGIDSSTGKRKTIKIEAATEMQALATARDRGLVGAEITSGGALGSVTSFSIGSKGKPKDVAIFIRAIATTADTLNLVDSIALAKTSLPKRSQLIEVVEEIEADIRAGVEIGVAFNRQGKHLGESTAAVFGAGSETGKLGELLTSLAEEMERAGRIQSQIISALMYPAYLSLLVAGMILIQAKMTFPNFITMIEEGGGTPPRVMTMVVDGVGWAEANLLGIAITLVVLLGTYIAFRGNQKFKISKARATTKTPLIGRITYDSAVSSFATQMGINLNAGLSMSRCMGLVSNGLKNAWLKTESDEVKRKIDAGVSPDVAIAASPAAGQVLPSLMRQSLSGLAMPGDPWTKYGEALGADVERRASRLTHILEPALVLVASLIVAAMSIITGLAISSLYQGAL